VTPTSGSRSELLVDTSVAVALLVQDHPHHQPVRQALAARRVGLAGHAVFETFSVLTRLPPPARRSASTVWQLIVRAFPDSRHLPEQAAADLPERLAALGIAGGAVYDALVGATAAHHHLPLASRDRRAADTYRLLDVDVVAVG
jgi:predicted nucleic acid-binding protein